MIGFLINCPLLSGSSFFLKENNTSKIVIVDAPLKNIMVLDT